MADVTYGDVQRAEVANDGVSLFGRLIAWLTGTRNGLLTIWILAGASALIAVLVMEVFGPFEGLLASPATKNLFLAASSLVALPTMLLFLDPSDNFQKGQRFALPAMSLLLLAGLAGYAVYDATVRGGAALGLATQAPTTVQLTARTAFVAFFIVAFLPNVWNATNFARFDAAQRSRSRAKSEQEQSESENDDDAEAIGALLATLAVLGIGVLAFVAGGIGSSLSFKGYYGLVLCSFVIGIFVVVVFLDLISDTPLVRALGRALHSFAQKLHFLAVFYNLVDTALVRIGASVAGMAQDTMSKRYGLLTLTLLALSLLSWFLPAPLGLAPALIGFILAMSVSRLWAWVEEDRALAAMTEYSHDAPYRVGFREDYRDETLLGFIFVFTLVPIAMMQAHVGQFFGTHLFEGADNKSFLDWFGFFGVELAKAVPIVDWAEIYNVAPADDLIQYETAASRHAVFLARVMVDMVLIASLLQAIGIATRNRQQKSLFRAGHIDRLDEFVERAELSRAIRTTRISASGAITTDLKGADADRHFDLTKLGRDGIVDFRRYNRDRLFFIYGSDRASLERRAFVATIAHQGSYELLHAIDLTRRIAETTKNEPAMYAAFDRALSEHDAGQKPIDGDDIYLILSDLRLTAGLRDFKQKLIESFTHICEPTEVLDKLRGLALGDKADNFQYTRNMLATAIAEAAPKVRDAELLQEALSDWQTNEKSDKRPREVDYHHVLRALRASLAAAMSRGQM